MNYYIGSVIKDIYLLFLRKKYISPGKHDALAYLEMWGLKTDNV